MNIEQDQDQDSAPEMSAEQAADFAALQAAANSGEPAPAGQGQDPEPARLKLADEISTMLGLLVGVVTPIFPSLAGIYTPEVIQAVGNASQPLCEKHGWLQDGVGGKYGEEIMFLAVVAPLAWATHGAVKTDLAARAATKPPEQRGGLIASAGIESSTATPDQVIDPRARTVTFGAVL